MDVPFRIKQETVPSAPGAWQSTRITILDDAGRELGSYTRNYESFADTTFRPFFLHGRWWALYSKDYTATRVMILPEAEDWCGEEPSTSGFCPVEYYVPRYRAARTRIGDAIEDAYIGEGAPGWDDPNEHGSLGYFDVSEPEYCPFGLVSGCIWADERSWKIEFLDLGKLPERKLVREARFGYLHLPDGLALKDAVDMELWRPDDPVLGLTNVRWQNSQTGETE